MLPFSTLIQLDRDAETAIYQQIAHQLAGLIRDGIIQPGARLPGSREMALLLQVHRKTVVAAYEELSAQDWTESIPRKGIMVSSRLPELKPRSFKAAQQAAPYAGNAPFAVANQLSLPEYPLAAKPHRLVINDGTPDSRLAPMDLLVRTYKELLSERYFKKMAPQASFAGTAALREALALFLRDTRGLSIGTENILVTRGAQMAIYLAAQMLLRKGDYVIVSRPNYYMADKVFEQAGAQLLRIPVDDQGIDVDAVEALCKKKKVRLLYIVPHHHYPTTVTLSMDRRMKLLDIIRRYQLTVVEDDYDYDFHYSSGPILPLASAGHGGNVIYIGSLTKTLSPSIRLGYMIGTADLIGQTTTLRRIMDIRGDMLLEDAIAILIRNGDIGRHLKKSNKIYHARRDYLAGLLTDQLPDFFRFRIPDGGMAIWAHLTPTRTLSQLALRVSEKGLRMNDGSYYFDGNEPSNSLRLGFAALREKEMEEAVDILKTALHEKTRRK
jgi:GntR family transcriptional regulator/MocR family aminotransferase